MEGNEMEMLKLRKIEDQPVSTIKNVQILWAQTYKIAETNKSWI